jgi:hypothetical protein
MCGWVIVNDAQVREGCEDSKCWLCSVVFKTNCSKLK